MVHAEILKITKEFFFLKDCRVALLYTENLNGLLGADSFDF